MNILSNLPSVLSEEEQKILLKKLPDEQARENLILGNLRLVFKIAKNFLYTEVSIEDLFSIGTIGLIKAVNSFSLDRNVKLSTFASKCIRNEILMYLRKEKRYSNSVVSLSTTTYIDNDGNKLFIEDTCADSKSSIFFDLYADLDNFISILNYLSNTLFETSYRDFLIFLYMLGGKKQQFLADYLNLSQSYISRLFKKFNNRIRLLNSSRCFSSKIIYPNYFSFSFSDNELFVGISKELLDTSDLDIFINEKTNDTYFFAIFPFLQESFISVAEMFQHLYELHLIHNWQNEYKSCLKTAFKLFKGCFLFIFN